MLVTIINVMLVILSIDIGQIPTLSNLHHIEWRNEKLQIIRKLSPEWEKVAIYLKQDLSLIDRWKRIYNEDSWRCCSKVFDYWLSSDEATDYCRSWKGILKLLNDVDHGSNAIKLKKILTNVGLNL